MTRPRKACWGVDKTPLYAEMGGQVADHGLLENDSCTLRVLDVKNPKGDYVHTCVLESGIVRWATA